MKNEFTLYTEKNNQPIIVNENSNTHLLKRCQDHWYHKHDNKYLVTEKNQGFFSKNRLLNKLSPPKYLFIHIPKTGGTSFKFNVLYNPHLKKKVAIYHKINYPPNNNRLLNVFKEKKKMFTLLRDPTDTVISSFYHFNHITKMGEVDYFNRFSNMQTKFLLGYDIFSNLKITPTIFNEILDLIDQNKLTVGILKTKSMNGIYNLLELKSEDIDDYILNKKVGISYKQKDISKSLRKHIRSQNIYDNKLYEYILRKSE